MKIKKIIYESSVIKCISYFPIDTISIFQFWYVSSETVLDVFYEEVACVLYEVVSYVLYEVVSDVFHERPFHDITTYIWRTPYRYDSLAIALKLNIYTT